MSERAYPIRPVPEEDPRFTVGLLLDVADVLTAHGFPEPASDDVIELRQALYRFLYGGAS